MASPAPVSLALLAGPQLLGFFFGWALQGVLSVQVYLYHLWFPRDTLATKILVYCIFIYEWIQTILVTQTAFDIDVYGYGSRTALTAFHNTWFSVTLMCAVISAVVQGYFSWRIWVLARSRVLPSIIIFFAFGQMAVGVTGGIMLNVVNPTASEASAVTPVISAWLAGAAFVDVIIAASMTHLLVRSKTGMKKSDAIVNRLVRLVVETGTLTAAVAIVDVICFTVIPQTLMHECPALVLAKLYSNTLLVSLNNRAFLRNGSNISYVDSIATTLPSAAFQSRTLVSQNTAVGSMQQGQHMCIEVTQEDYISRDVRDVTLRDTESGSVDKVQGGIELARMDTSTTDKER